MARDLTLGATRKHRVRTVLALASTFVAIALSVGTPAWAAPKSQGTLAPPSQAFRDYQTAHAASRAVQTAASGGRALGFVPPPAPSIAPASVVSVVFAPPASYTAPAAPLLSVPAAYDLRTLGKLTAVRDQGRFGTCWTFATMASLESALLPGQTADFSEHNLADLSLFSWGYNDGGNAAMSAAYLTRWSGPVSEMDDPYPTGVAWPSSPAGLTVSEHVQNIDFLPERSGPTDNANLKWAIMTYGAVDTAMEWDDDSFHGDTASYYYSGDGGGNHAVALVGWNDNYPASSFATDPTTTPPPGNGAFLIRNSWGSSWGRGGYFWLSYYDSVCPTESVAFYGVEPTTNYTRAYQYDPLGWTSDFGYGDPTAWFANAFTATYSGTVNAVGFYTSTVDAAYEVRVASSVSGIATASAAATGTLHVPGFHTVTLPAPAAISAGTPFVVAVKLTEAGSTSPVAVEAPETDYAAAAASSGQSYVSADGTSWSDMTSTSADTNVCLKTYVDDNGPAPGPSPAPASGTPTVSGVASSTDPDTSKWYASHSVQVQWQASSDAAEYSWALDHSSGAVPDATADGTSASAAFNGVADGVWYFHVRAGGTAGWGAAVGMRLQVDTTGPRTTALGPSSARRHAVSTVRFKVADALSPTALVVIRVYHGQRMVTSLRAGLRATGKTQSSKWRCLLPRGRYVLRVYATDLAGNPQEVVGHRALTVR